MAKGGNNFKISIVEMVILFILKRGDFYGYQLVNLVRKLSKGELSITESTLYPTMYKLLQNGYISDHEKNTGNSKRRVYYHIEEYGEKRLFDLIDEYNTLISGIESIFFAGEEEYDETNN